MGEYHELKSDMLDNKEYIIANIKEKDAKKKELKIIQWFMFNEVSSYPMHPSNFLPEWEQSQEGGRDQSDTLQSLTNLDQTTPTGKKKRTTDNQSVKDDSHREKATTQSYGCKMRVLFGYDKGIPCATITSSKEEIDNQFWYPKRSRVIKEYKDIKDNYSWSSEDDSEMVDTESTKNAPSPRIYDLRTPLKESKRTDTPKIVLLFDSAKERKDLLKR